MTKSPREWTEEEKRLAMTYGLCWACREPRFGELSTRIENGRVIYERRLTCPNGHSQ